MKKNLNKTNATRIFNTPSSDGRIVLISLDNHKEE